MESERSLKWEVVFAKGHILEKIADKGFADIASAELHALGFEPRLLTKLDHSDWLPPIMAKNGLSLLAVSLNSWRIGHFDIYCRLPEWESPGEGSIHAVHLPQWISSLDPEAITGEGGVMAAAFASGMLAEVCGDKDVAPTIQGRQRAGAFDFSVQDSVYGHSEIKMAGTQIEIDAGYETRDAIVLVEAKRRQSKDFNLKQLYYPFRAWRQRVSKPVRTFYVTHANDVFDWFEYEFLDPNELSSSNLVAHQRFMINPAFPSKSELAALAKDAIAAPGAAPQGVPFPQADNFERIIDLVDFLASEDHQTANSIATYYEFDPRQSDYYFNAARYLGLAEATMADGELGAAKRRATTHAAAILAMPRRAKYLEFARLALGVEPVAKVFMEALSGQAPSPARTQELFAASPTSAGLSGSTLGRRAQTINAWTHWLLRLDGK